VEEAAIAGKRREVLFNVNQEASFRHPMLYIATSITLDRVSNDWLPAFNWLSISRLFLRRDMSDDSEVEPGFEDQEVTGSEALRLDHYLKSRGISETGGQAKLMIQNGEVKLNGQVETRRRKKLVAGDVIEVNREKFVIE